MDINIQKQYNSVYELCDDIFQKYYGLRKATDTKDVVSIGVVGYYDNICSVAEELIRRGVSIHFIDTFGDSELADYSGEYYLSIGDFFEDNDIALFIEKAKINDTSYYEIINNVVMVFGDCNSKILNSIKAFCVNQIDIEEECIEN